VISAIALVAQVVVRFLASGKADAMVGDCRELPRIRGASREDKMYR
jgi:hypothetical protein